MSEQDERTIRELKVAVNGLSDRVFRLEQRLEQQVAGGGAGGARGPGGSPAETPVNASIEGEYGDPLVKIVSSRWQGQSYKDKRFSQCSPEFLRDHAGFLEWCAANPFPGKEKYARYNLMDAARARLWADRIEGVGSDGCATRTSGGAPPGRAAQAGPSSAPPDFDEYDDYGESPQKDLF